MSDLVQQWLLVGTKFGDIKMYTERRLSVSDFPAVLILHSVMGIDEYLKTLTRQFAKEGYWAVAPDLYSNDGGYRELEVDDIGIAAHMSRDTAEREVMLSAYAVGHREKLMKASNWIAGRRTETYTGMVEAVFRYIRSFSGVRDVGAIGFCMGGRLVGELAERAPDLAAGVMHYGRPPSIEAVDKIRSPLQGHYASRDPNITEKVPAFAAAMSEAGKAFTHYVYEADHGFSLAPHLSAHNFESARLSLCRSRRFLRECLRPEMWPADQGT